MEALESRRLLAATIDLGVLTVLGTERDDTIAFERRGTGANGQIVVHLNGEQTVFDAARVRRVRVDALGGNDTVVLGRRLGLPAEVQGGTGNDTISGSPGADTLLGGAGDDLIDGRGGADYLDGGRGNDRMFSLSTSELSADLGSTIHGGAGVDTATVHGQVFFGSGVEEVRYQDSRGHGAIVDPVRDALLAVRYAGQFVRSDAGALQIEWSVTVPASSFGANILDARVRGTNPRGHHVRFELVDPPVNERTLRTYSRRFDVTAEALPHLFQLAGPEVITRRVELPVGAESNRYLTVPNVSAESFTLSPRAENGRLKLDSRYTASSSGFRVGYGEIERVSGGYVVNADVEFVTSAAVLPALQPHDATLDLGPVPTGPVTITLRSAGLDVTSTTFGA